MNWVTINSDSEITSIHAALLPTAPDGVVLYFGDWAVSGNIGVQNITHGRLYHVSNDSIETIAEGFSPDTDAFCCGQSFLSDGRLLAAGALRAGPNSTMSMKITMMAKGPAGSICLKQSAGCGYRICTFSQVVIP